MFLVNLKSSQNNKSENKNQKNFAFSLIELSIVLIIIGLLVAGVTGGASLIESAKIQNIINEFRNYRQSVYAFKAIRDRLPGDVIGSGKIGFDSDQNYDDTSFGAPYIASDNDYGIPDLISAPFVAMYLEKVIDYEPKKIVSESGVLSTYKGGCPRSKSGIGVFGFYYKIPSTASDDYLYNIKEGNYLRWHSWKDGSNYFDIKPKIFEKIDKKLDDGVYNSGIIRGQCFPVEYETDYNEATTCRGLYYFLDI